MYLRIKISNDVFYLVKENLDPLTQKKRERIKKLDPIRNFIDGKSSCAKNGYTTKNYDCQHTN